MAKNILVAEDEPNIVESLKFLLTRAGFETIIAVDGHQAIRMIRDLSPDILILDVMLPGIDGYEILRQVRADQYTKQLPVLMLTAKGQKEDRETALKYGANLFITKPFANADIITAIEQLAVLSEG